MDDGYLKFNPNWKQQTITMDADQLEKLNTIRQQLKNNNWLGQDAQGIGFGNISIRHKNSNQFYITGSATGAISNLQPKHMALVTDIRVNENSLSCMGKTVASSESLSHGVCYKHNKMIQAVIHIHDTRLWQHYLHQLPTSDPSISYGTPEMALSIVEKMDTTLPGIVVMGGHQNGLIAYGNSLNETYQYLLSL